MAIEFCPLEAAWGNWGDWAAVVVGVFAAVATILVAKSANRTAKAAVEIASKQHSDAVTAKDEAAEMVRRILAVEIAVLPAKLGGVLNTLDKAAFTPTGMTIALDDWEWLADQLSRTFLPGVEEFRESLSSLGVEHGGKLASLIGFGRVVTELAQRFDAKVPRPEGESEVKLGLPGADYYKSLRKHVKQMLRQSLAIAPYYAAVATDQSVSYEDMQKQVDAED